jgi:hypothetical protein
VIRLLSCAAAIAALAWSAAAQAGQFGLNLYGLSYHFERDRAKQIGTANEFNPGIGLRWRAKEGGGWFADAGLYHDSGRNTALLAGGGYLWSLGENWRLGGAITAFHSDTYNRGRAFVAPLPVLAYETRRYSVNLTFLPKLGRFNEINTLGLWVTFW